MKTIYELFKIANDKAAAMGVKDWRAYCAEATETGVLITGCRAIAKIRGKNKGEFKFFKKEYKKTFHFNSKECE